MKKTCVIGWPIAHSRSPLIHNYWLKLYGIDSVYEKVSVPPEQLVEFVQQLPKSDYLGCNVTIPHKESAFELAAVRDPLSSRLSAANTLYVRNGAVHCTSTDGEGFIANLCQQQTGLILTDSKAVVLGAGGSARSIIPALLDQGVASIGIINRTAERVDALKESFGTLLYHVEDSARQAALASCDVLVNTTSLGMQGQPPLDFDVTLLKNSCLVIDIIYTPLETRLLRDAKKLGLRTVGGLGMLLHQAVRGFELWYGVQPEVTPQLWSLIEADVRRAEASA
jgi:shikimate dehydrogenase